MTRYFITIALLMSLGAVACDRSKEAEQVESVSVAENEDGEHDATKAAEPDSVTFDHAKDWAPCAAMPASVASTALGTPADQLESNEFGKICIHNRKGGDESTEAYAQIGAFNVFETVDKAKARFKASTADKGEAEMKAMNDEIRKKANEKLDEEANPEGKKKAAGDVMDALAGAVSYEAVSEVGDEAAMGKHDGQLHVRAGNAYFYVLGWSGPAIGNRSAPTVEGAKKKLLDHLGKNWDAQKKLQVELAKAVIAEMQK